MKRFLTIGRLSIMFVAVFAVALGGMFAWEVTVRHPEARCEAGGKWWDREGRVCAQPISIAEITGRPIGVSRAEASREKNRELVEIEDRLAAAEKARDLDADRQRAALRAERESR